MVLIGTEPSDEPVGVVRTKMVVTFTRTLSPAMNLPPVGDGDGEGDVVGDADGFGDGLAPAIFTKYLFVAVPSEDQPACPVSHWTCHQL